MAVKTLNRFENCNQPIRRQLGHGSEVLVPACYTNFIARLPDEIGSVIAPEPEDDFPPNF